MGSRGVLTKNYFIYPETVAEYGAEIERVMTETDRAMEEASEIIAKMASVTERIPSQIRSGELLELCETAQAEIRSFDFLSYGKRVNQGLLNLLDQNQYITENFIKKMEATTERMREFGAGCRRLTELIDYSGGSQPLKGLALSAVSNVEMINTDEKLSDRGEERLQNDDSRIVLKQLMEIVDILQQNKKVIKRLEVEGKSVDYIIHTLIELRDQYPEFYNRINQSDIDEIMIYCRYIEMQDMVAVACEEVGKPRGKETIDTVTDADGKDIEVGLNDVYYNDWYYGWDNRQAWCSVFVLWCANEVNLLDGEQFPTYEEAINGNFEGVKNLREYFEDNFIDRYHSWHDDPDYIPCVGDFVFMEANNQNHIGIVVGYDDEKNIIYTVEGNAGNTVSFQIRNWNGGYAYALVNNGGDVASIPENIEDFENGDNSSTR